ncbi:hypothetical protein SUGI_0289660 [Cryptomeria japonica]|uniref:universal stress protein A-like protein n=1 Tax=Cryptomeria japonica TaxID=3369 RepID=UPI002408DB6C|nr:universal stress protein A-like protein [Cryptomeria japonica]GLJ16812.1 hypothetical protein SUGI_0289660 [Cryptomeria japonica]
MEQGQVGPTRIVIAVNQSSLKGYPHPSISSSNAFEWALKKLIRSTRHKDFKLYILHVQVPDEDAFNDVDSIFACPDDFKDLKNREKIKGIHLLEYFVKRCNEIGLACEAWIKRGNPNEVICNEVKRLHPDILVVGSRVLNQLEKVFVGTVSEFCSKHADCPVIVIKRKPEDTPQNPIDD